MNGLERIRAVFEAKRAGEGAAYMPYHAMGFPSRALTLQIIAAEAESGADLFEIGIPHSDPLADGPTVQAATYTAITQGTTVADCLAMVSEVRAAGVEQPFCAMTYYNPLFAYGVERFAQDAVVAGVDGLIVPDLPPEEGAEVEAACAKAGLAMNYLLAPTSTDARIRYVAAHTTGFIYLVSITGITGARSALPTDLAHFVARVRRQTDLPLAVGFGISTQEQAAAVASFADGVIVGSALVKAADSQDGVDAVRRLSRQLAEGSHTPTPISQT